jgi:hypothetical protein
LAFVGTLLLFGVAVVGKYLTSSSALLLLLALLLRLLASALAGAVTFPLGGKTFPMSAACELRSDTPLLLPVLFG